LPISLDLRSEKLYLNPFALKMVPMEWVKCFHDFCHSKFKHESVDFELLTIYTYLREIAFQQLQGGFCNEFDNSSFELKGFESAF